jgi:hypothetical protein
LLLLPVIIGVTLITFTISFVIPANPARAWAGQKAPPETVEKIKDLLIELLCLINNPSPEGIVNVRAKANDLFHEILDRIAQGENTRLDSIILSFLLSSSRTIKIYTNILSCIHLTRNLGGRI